MRQIFKATLALLLFIHDLRHADYLAFKGELIHLCAGLVNSLFTPSAETIVTGTVWGVSVTIIHTLPVLWAEREQVGSGRDARSYTLFWDQFEHQAAHVGPEVCLILSVIPTARIPNSIRALLRNTAEYTHTKSYIVTQRYVHALSLARQRANIMIWSLCKR